MIPSVERLATSPLMHRFGDLFNPPGVTNFLGCVQVDTDPVAVRALNFPPLGSGDFATGMLFLDETIFAATGAPITYSSRPDRVVRETEHAGLRLRTTTTLPPHTTATLVAIELTNTAGVERAIPVRLALVAAATKQLTSWNRNQAPYESEHGARVEQALGAVIFTARRSGAVHVQGASPRPDDIHPAALVWTVRLRPGETWAASFVVAIGEDEASAVRAYRSAMAPGAAEAATTQWNDELRAMFTPGNARYSGSMPELETDDEDIALLYWMGVYGVACFRRDTPLVGFGRAYDTLMPRCWAGVTFLWDYHLSGTVHALLDPAEMRDQLQRWMTTDIHTCVGTDWVSGSPVGMWYSVNDYAMSRMVYDYVRWTGDTSWLTTPVAGTSVADHVTSYATNWKNFLCDNGLADYGGIGNLLECVSTYVHEVASLNAASVWSMRFAADLQERLGEGDEARRLRAMADPLAAEVLKLYVDGRGFWNTRRPDGRLVPVRHCYDFITIMATMAGDLDDHHLAEMVDFCDRELRTPTWMHALSPADPDGVFSLRADHQWTGAYPAWPPQAVAGLYRAGREDIGFEWFKGLAKSANQGPFGQAHFAESVVAPDAGGARKAPFDLPYITDWACSSNGSFAEVVLSSIFGVEAKPDGTITARPRFGAFDPGARLLNLSHAGRLYNVDAGGIREVGT